MPAINLGIAIDAPGGYSDAPKPAAIWECRLRRWLKRPKDFDDRQKKVMQKVKLVRGKSTHIKEDFLKQFPYERPVWNNLEFTFDLQDKVYDWLVVIDRMPWDLPWQTEELACPPEQTIFITTEPSRITYYGESFVNQFSYLITNQNEKALPHPNAKRTQPGSRWYYGKTYSQIVKEPPHEKTGLVSAIASHKRQKHTMHNKRFEFLKRVVSEIPEADLLFSRKHMEGTFQDLFGDRAVLVPTKYDMIDKYKYHLAIGNQEGKDILTERVSDSFLGYAVPISFGCTNLCDYFPEDSFIAIDINDPDRAIEKIKQVIYDEGDYERRLPSVIEARRKVLDEYNVIAMIAEIVESHRPGRGKSHARRKIYGRRMTRALSVKDLVGFTKFKLRSVLSHE